MSEATELSLDEIRPLVAAAEELVAKTLERTRELTGGALSLIHI